MVVILTVANLLHHHPTTEIRPTDVRIIDAKLHAALTLDQTIHRLLIRRHPYLILAWVSPCVLGHTCTLTNKVHILQNIRVSGLDLIQTLYIVEIELGQTVELTLLVYEAAVQVIITRLDGLIGKITVVGRIVRTIVIVRRMAYQILESLTGIKVGTVIEAALTLARNKPHLVILRGKVETRLTIDI